MDTNEWLNTLTGGATAKEIARNAGISERTLQHQVQNGKVSVENAMKISVAYIPNGRVLGLSKIARICDMASKRLQLQERIGSDVAQIMTEAAGTDDVAVIIHGTHSCMSARGIKKEAASTVTTTLRGRFETDAMLQNQLYMMLAAQ